MAPGPRPVESIVFQLSLDDFRVELPDLQLEVGDKRYSLRKHDASTRAEQRAENTLLFAIPDDELTHYATNVAVPADAPQSYRVTYAIPGDDTLRAIALAGIHIPRAGVAAAQALSGASFGYRKYRIEKLGLTLGAPRTAGGLHTLSGPLGSGDITDLDHFTDEWDCARYLAFHHSDVLSLDKSAAALVISHIDASPALADVARIIKEAGLKTLDPDASEALSAWSRGVYSKDPDGNLIQQTDDDNKPIVGSDGKPRYEWHYETDAEVREVLNALVASAVARLHDDKNLERVRFHIPTARLTDAEPLPDSGDALLGAPASSAYTFKPLSEGWKAGQLVSNLSVTADRKASFRVSNSYNRHLGVHCAFLDAGDKPLKRSDIAAKPGSGILPDTEYCSYMGLLAPPPYILGIPLPSPFDVSHVDLSVEIPTGASKLAILTSALAANDGDYRDEYKSITLPAKIGTLIFEVSIPTISLAYGALWTTGTWKTFVDHLLVPALNLIYKSANILIKLEQGGEADFNGLVIFLGNTVLKLILSKAITDVYQIYISAVVAGQVRYVPLLGTAIVAVQAAETAANLAKAFGAILLGQSVTQTTVSSTNRVTVTVIPETLGFPALANKWSVAITPKGGTTSSATGALKADGTASITADFPTIVSGGEVDIVVKAVFASTDPNGKDYALGGYTGVFTNVVASGGDRVAVAVQIKNYPIPILSTTVYSTNQKLTVDPTSGAHVLGPTTEQPPGAVPDACLGGSARVCAPIAIGLDADSGQLGYGWNATDPSLTECDTGAGGGSSLYTMQNINLAVAAGGPDANVKRYTCGRTNPVIPLYSLHGRDAGGSYVFEGSGGAYRLRKLGLSADDASFTTGVVVATGNCSVVRGAATNNTTAMVLSNADTLEVIDLTKTGTTSMVRGGPGRLKGHLGGAVAIARLYDGDGFLVLENDNKRIQAFGLTGEPLAYFGPDTAAGQANQKVEFLDLASDEDLLDIAVEENSRKIFVLSRRGLDGSVESFWLRIYDPKTKTQLAATQRFAAAKITFDTQQNIYALGWNSLLYKGRSEPGLWRWSPSLPPAGGIGGG